MDDWRHIAHLRDRPANPIVESLWLEDAENGHAVVKGLLSESTRLLQALADPEPDALRRLAREYLYAACLYCEDASTDRQRLLRITAALGAAADVKQGPPDTGMEQWS